MPEKENNPELLRASESLDGDREAIPLLSLLKRRLAALDAANEALIEARAAIEDLEVERTRLESAVAEIETRVVDLARKRDLEEETTETDSVLDDGTLITALRGRIVEASRRAARRAGEAASAESRAPVPAERLAPGFATGASFRARAGKAPPGAPPVPVAGVGAGVRNARSAGERMVQLAQSTGPKAEKAGEKR